MTNPTPHGQVPEALIYAELPDLDDTLWLAIGQHRRAITIVETSAAAKAVDAAVHSLLRAYADATHALRASHGQASSQAGEYPALVCDYCGALTPDPWHSSGMLHGKMSKHIHSCDACAARGAQDTREPLTPEQIQDLLLCGNPTDEEMRLIRIGWDAARGIKGGQHGTE